MVVKLSSSKMANKLFLLLNSLILKIPKQHFYCSFADVDSGTVLLTAPRCNHFVNGLPLVFVELKNAIIKIEEAVNKNLTDYKKDIPNLFAFNQICVLSNGLETRLGVFWHTQGSGKSFSMVFFARKCARKLKGNFTFFIVTDRTDLAENMHTALPNANFIAFTGTPLPGSKRLTNQWFGNYVSKYNFAQSVEDGSTVPLFYSRRLLL